MRFPKPNNIVAEKYVAGMSLFKSKLAKIKLSANESALGPSPKAKKQYLEVSKNFARYPDSDGTFLRNTLANKFKIDKLQKKYEELKNEFLSNSKLLSESRRKSAIYLSKKINDELPHLKLENANFRVKFEELELENATEIGMDKVIFLASTNSGADALPINKIASGGELSRFLLAIKVVLETMAHQRTIIFDEIDSGIGGAAANAVGIRLAKLGNNYQTMVVTHSPQVTSKGHYHYLVQKNNINNNITTNVTQLNETERVEEIARMVSGSIITNEAREAASKLLNT